MSYYDFRDNRGFYDYQDNTKEHIKQELEEYKTRTRKNLIIFLVILILLNALAIYFIRLDMVYNLARNIEEELTESLKRDITNEVLLEHRREYYLPENYNTIGVMVAAQALDSVVEIVSTSATRASTATGFIINEQGYLMTNAHVVTYERAGLIGGSVVHSSIKANFANSTVQYSLTVVDYNISRDLAILKFDNPPENLKPVVFADSDMISIGEECVVIGNAEGLGTAVTVGCFANLPQKYDGTEVVRTDAAINPGNSGGPMLNIYSEVVAMATFKIVASEASEGLGFGVSSNEMINYIKSVNLVKGLNIQYNLSNR